MTFLPGGKEKTAQSELVRRRRENWRQPKPLAVAAMPGFISTTSTRPMKALTGDVLVSGSGTPLLRESRLTA